MINNKYFKYEKLNNKILNLIKKNENYFFKYLIHFLFLTFVKFNLIFFFIKKLNY